MQISKAECPIVLTDDGISICSNEWQLKSAPDLIEVFEDGTSTCFKDEP